MHEESSGIAAAAGLIRQGLLDCMKNAYMMAFNEKTLYHSISFNCFRRAYR
jgi:hypothetical protein